MLNSEAQPYQVYTTGSLPRNIRLRSSENDSSSYRSSSTGGSSIFRPLALLFPKMDGRRGRSKAIVTLFLLGMTWFTISTLEKNRLTTSRGIDLNSRQLSDDNSTIWGKEGNGLDVSGARSGRGAARSQPPYISLDIELPKTQYLGGIGGYNMFENLYLQNGTFFAITDDPSPFPPVSRIMSAAPTDDGKTFQAGADRWQVITPGDALALFKGQHVITRIPGSTFFLTDSKGPAPRSLSAYLGHYFHFVAENFLGAWRLQTSLHTTRTGLDTSAGVEMPSRIMIGHADPKDWHDRPGLIAWWLHTFLPGTAIEDSTVFADRATSGSLQMLDTIAIIDRWASHRHNPTAQAWNKMNGDVSKIPAPADWWVPLRSRALQLAGLVENKPPSRPVLTYINRQKTGRRLNGDDHAGLVAVLEELDKKGLIEFHNAFMEDYSRLDQFGLALKTDILLGVHGNGLTHTMWQKPGSVLIEMMDAGGFVRDYQILGEAFGHDYYCIWNDMVNEDADWRARGAGKTTKGFHGSDIRVSPTFMSTLLTRISQDKYHVVDGGD